MPKKSLLPTPEITNQICSFIRAGGFPHVAAEAAGVPRLVFEDWLRRGNVKQPRQHYKQFSLAVTQATAHARLQAEIAAKQDNPIAWLRSGPGKETKESPGWTRTIGPQITTNNQSLNLMMHPEMLAIFQTLMHLLAPHPELRTQVAAVLAGAALPAIEAEVVLAQPPSGNS